FAQYLLQHMRQLPEHETEVKGKWQQAKIPESLLNPSNEPLEKAEYKKELDKLSKKIADAMRFDQRNVVIAFEGMDA
ncbi:phosphate--AMP phosphotransferase, partial [Acinetobacter nosocomialis]